MRRFGRNGCALRSDVCLDEVEIYAPAWATGSELPSITLGSGLAARPVTRTRIEAEARPVRIEGEQEVMDLVVRNAGPMTALFCEARPLIEYRTDLFIRNNHVCIPPSESRTISISARSHASGGLSLAQTGWRISAWNTDERVIEPAPSVLIALGRRDQICREFLGYSDPNKIGGVSEVSLHGSHPDASQVPYLLRKGTVVRLEFQLSRDQAAHSARLRIHTADQAESAPTTIEATINGRRMEGTLPRGLGIQQVDPAHLAFPATAEFQIPASNLRPGKNSLEVRVQGDGWFSWDAMDLTSIFDEYR
ncbi:MAG: hypothetical protein NT154_00155 [Verrucomicrobia bacterium]|nr:hypothetical protein [Verrucomicrobiota bacterium]